MKFRWRSVPWPQANHPLFYSMSSGSRTVEGQTDRYPIHVEVDGFLAGNRGATHSRLVNIGGNMRIKLVNSFFSWRLAQAGCMCVGH